MRAFGICLAVLLCVFSAVHTLAQEESEATIFGGIEVSHARLNGNLSPEGFDTFLDEARSARSILFGFDSISTEKLGAFRSTSLDIKFDISHLFWKDSTVQNRQILVGIGTGRDAAHLYNLTASDTVDTLLNIGYYAQQFRVMGTYRFILNPKNKFKIIASPSLRFGVDVSGELRTIGDSLSTVTMNPEGQSYLSYKGYHLMADIPFGFQWKIGEDLHFLMQYGVGVGIRRLEKRTYPLLSRNFHFGIKIDL